MAIRIAGTTALVTGANRGIGRALVEALLARGASKIYATARKPDTLAAIVEQSAGRVVPIRLDVTRPNEVRAAAALADDVRLLMNNAGIVAKLGGELTDAQWIAAARDEYETNVLGALAVTQALLPAIASKPGGAIANIASMLSFGNLAAVASYSASKAALHSLTQAIRALVRPQGIYVAGVYPGPIDTEMARDFPVAKSSAESAAQAILDGLEAGREEIFPDPFAEQVGELFLRNPKAVEEQFAASLTAA